MIAVISPSKTLDEKHRGKIDTTKPRFERDASILTNILKKYKVDDLMDLMNISEKLAHQNFLRFRKFKDEPFFPAAWLFKGDVFRGLMIEDFTDKEIDYAQDHIFILSGLYGFLRFRDAIHPYRLEMGTALKNTKGKDLYEYWGDRVYKELLKETKTDIIVNLASKEYSRVLNLRKSRKKVIDVEFLELRKGAYTQIPLFSKKARGLMARYMAKNQITDLEELKGFDYEGYDFNESLSDSEKFVFTR